MAVFVLDRKKKPLMPCSEKRARLLLERKKAVVHRMAPFTIRLKDRIGGETQPIRIKLDPGSKTAGRLASSVPPTPGRHDRLLGGATPSSGPGLQHFHGAGPV